MIKRVKSEINKMIAFLMFIIPGILNAQVNQDHHPVISFMDDLVLIEEINCAQATHGFYTNGTTEVKTLLGKECRILKPSGTSKFFYYRIGANAQLKAGKAYFLEIEYPDDTDRSFVVQNRGGEYNRGIQTGKTLGDMYSPPYVQSNPESVSLPHSMKYMKWQTLFWLHDQYAGLTLPKNAEGTRPERPGDGFLVIICQFDSKNDPFNNGAAISAIRLYEAPDFATLDMDIHYPPAGLPRRHLFFREEMADGVVDASPPAVSNTIDFFEHEAQLMQFLGMNTFSKDLLEFGHNQGWDPGPYANLVNTPAWKDRWEKIISMLGKYKLSVMPYYEYTGTIGPQGLGPKQRAHPLNDKLPDYDYTHISWVENVNADITDPATYDDLKKIFERTIINYKDQIDFVGAWLRPRPSENPISFADAALERFRTEANGGIPVTRAQLKSNTQLYEKYLDWWFGKRKDFLLDMRDYLRNAGVNDSAIILYTTDYSEPGKTHYDWGYSHNVITDDKTAWQGLSFNYPVYDLDEYINKDWHLEAQLLPENTWGDWEWQHSVPVPDPDKYQDEEGVILTYTFNKAYTVGSKNAFDQFRSKSGLAIIRHYCLNEDGMEGMGYFVTDFEWHGPYTMLAEARAMANGDPWHIGYLASASFNKGSVAYVREFNANFLALPALPSTLVEGAASDPEVIVRKIETNESGTYLAVINTSLADKDSVNITLPQSYDIADARTGLIILADTAEIILKMYPAQLKSYTLLPVTGKMPQFITIEDIPGKTESDETFKITASASSGLDVSWKLISGPATLVGDSVSITGDGWIKLEAVQAGNENYYPASAFISVRIDPDESTSLNKPTKASTVCLYPVPSSNSLYIEIPYPMLCEVFDTRGNKLMYLQLKHSQYIDISCLSSGVYFIQCSNRESREVYRFVKA